MKLFSSKYRRFQLTQHSVLSKVIFYLIRKLILSKVFRIECDKLKLNGKETKTNFYFCVGTKYFLFKL